MYTDLAKQGDKYASSTLNRKQKGLLKSAKIFRATALLWNLKRLNNSYLMAKISISSFCESNVRSSLKDKISNADFQVRPMALKQCSSGLGGGTSSCIINWTCKICAWSLVCQARPTWVKDVDCQALINDCFSKASRDNSGLELDGLSLSSSKDVETSMWCNG